MATVVVYHDSVVFRRLMRFRRLTWHEVEWFLAVPSAGSAFAGWR
jgi:hypothetical protein